MWSCVVRIDIFVILLSNVYLDLCQEDFGSPPEIKQQIASLPNTGSSSEIAVGGIAYLYITATGSTPLHYIWLKDGTVKANNTNTDHRIENADISDTGSYQCIVQNDYGAVMSLPFLLTVKALGEFNKTVDVNVNVDEGSFTVLKMENISYLKGGQGPKWELENTLVNIDDPKYHVSLTNDLAILDTPVSFDGNKYKTKLIHVTGAFLQTESHAYILDVKSIANSGTFIDPELVIRPRDTVAVVDESKAVILECVINGRPLTNLQTNWYKVSGATRTEISDGNKYSLSAFARFLTIKNVAEMDAGIYECEGRLTGRPGIVSANATLTVHVKPVLLVQPPFQVTKDFQESFVLSCEVHGLPKPSVEWYFNARKISSAVEDRYEVFSNGTLSINNVDLPDSGIYQCFVRNSAGESATYTKLHVNSAEPTMVVPPKSAIVAEGEDAKISCVVKGGPKPFVYWTTVPKGKNEEVNVTIGGRIQMANDNELLIGEVEMGDSGLYVCHAVNLKGSISANATLGVIVKTEINLPPQNGSKIVATDVVLNCGVKRDVTIIPTWSWYFSKAPDFNNRQQILNEADKTRIFPNGTLIIYGIQGRNSGKYECVVTSEGGDDSRFALINVIDLPDPPTITSVTLYDPEPNSVLINWTLTYDGDSPILKFVIMFRQESSLGFSVNGPWEVISNNVDAKLRSVVVGGLHPSRFYRFQMFAVNEVGNSGTSNRAPVEAIKMPSQPPSESPENLFCKQDGEQRILVQWDAPPESSWNGELLGYIVFYKVDAFKEDTEKETVVSGKGARSVTLTNLAYNKRYRVKITAFNEKGRGKNSKPFYVTTLQGRPSAPPSNVVLTSPNSTTIRVEWDPPPQRELNGFNLGYEIELYSGGDLKKVEIAPFIQLNPTGRQAYDIVNLMKYTEYSIQLTCRTAAGAGPKSTKETIRTQEDVPGPVFDLRIDNVEDKTLRVNWMPPREINGVLRGYLIKYQMKNDPSSILDIERGPDATSHTLQGLQYETTYVISVQARTNVGPGPAETTEIDSGVPPELPGPPSSLDVTNIRDRSCSLKFIPGFDGKTVITTWIVEAQVGSETKWTNIYNYSDPRANVIEVKNLKPYTKYTLRLRAKNVVGVSREASEPSDPFETNEAAPGMPPDSLTPRAISPTAMKIRWRQIPRTEWNGKYLGYKIQYRRWMKDVDVNNTLQANIDLVRQQKWSEVVLRNGSTVDEHTLYNLEEGMDYEIRMVSYNAKGNSKSSDVITEKTDEDAPSASPQNVALYASSSTSIEVTWSQVPILQQNGNITGYKVMYKALPSGSEKFQKVKGANNLNVTLRGLRKFVSYSVQVLAFTERGDGVLSHGKDVKTFGDVPGPPVVIYFTEVTKTTATIHWNSPQEPNGIILEYRVAYRRSDEGQSAMDDNVVDKLPTEFQHQVTGLTGETDYIFSVTAKTEFGWGEAANVKVYTFANRGPPDAPENVRIDTTQLLPRSMTVTWTQGNNNYGPVRNFTVEYKERQRTWETVDEIIGPERTSYTVKNLYPNTYYKFRVAATNDVGTSLLSQETSERKTDIDKPDAAPEDVKIEALTRTSIKISWKAPPKLTWNGDLISDIIEFREEDVEEFRDVTIPFGQLQHTMTGLIMDTRYEFRVRSANGAGQGPPSKLQVFRVGDVAPFDPPMDVRMKNISSTVIEITWKPPLEESTNGDLTGYQVRFWSASSSACIEENIQQRSVPEPHISLPKLKPYTIYCCTVQAVNGAGEGPRSQVKWERTSEDYPGVPENFRFQNITLHDLVVQWDAPKVANGRISFYTLQYYVSIDDQRDISMRIIPGDKREEVVTNLIENQLYTFTLAANTSIGRGEAKNMTIVMGPQPGSPESPKQPQLTRTNKNLIITWENRGPGASPIRAYQIRYREKNLSDKWSTLKEIGHPEPKAEISLTRLKLSQDFQFLVRAINSHGISPPSPFAEFKTPASLVAKPREASFDKQWWFLVIVALAGVIVILLVITLLCYIEKRNKGKKLKRSATNTTVMSEIPEPEDGGFPSAEMRDFRRSLSRNGKVQNNIYSRSPPRPSPASVTYSEGIATPVAGAMAAAASIKPPLSDETSSVMSDKPSNLGDSSEESSDDSDDSSNDSIAKAPVPASPPPPAFSSHYPPSHSNGAGASSSSNNNSNSQNPPWRFQSPHNAYTYTDSEAESSHYAFSLNNGNIVVNNVAGARTPLSGFSSFV